LCLFFFFPFSPFLLLPSSSASPLPSNGHERRQLARHEHRPFTPVDPVSTCLPTSPLLVRARLAAHPPTNARSAWRRTRPPTPTLPGNLLPHAHPTGRQCIHSHASTRSLHSLPPWHSSSSPVAAPWLSSMALHGRPRWRSPSSPHGPSLAAPSYLR
jgi:hypothetical protein